MNGAESDEVIQRFNRAMEMRPEYAPVYLRLGDALWRRGAAAALDGRQSLVDELGEHQCSRVVVNDETYPVDHRYFSVHLGPGAGAELVVYADRYANRPTLALPWHGDTVPLAKIQMPERRFSR